MEVEEASSKAKSCFGTRLCEEIMPQGGWRRKACVTLFVAVLAVMIVSVCCVPSALYLIAQVSAKLIIVKTQCMHKANRFALSMFATYMYSLHSYHYYC